MLQNLQTKASYLILLFPPLFWSGNFIVGRALANQEIPVSLSFYRWVLALILLAPFAIGPVYRQRAVIKRYFWKLAILAFFSITVFNTLAYIGLQYTSATNGTLMNSFIPVYILFISGVFLGNPISYNQKVGLGISFSGILVIISQLDPAIILNLKINKGDIWMLLATLDWAIYSILLKKYKPQGLDAVSLLAVMIFLGLIFLLPLFLINPFNEAPLQLTTSNTMALLYIAIFPSILAYLAWNYGILQIGAEKGGQFVHLMPVFGAIMAVVFLNETIYLYHIIGGLFIAVGLWMSLRSL